MNLIFLFFLSFLPDVVSAPFSLSLKIPDTLLVDRIVHVEDAVNFYAALEKKFGGKTLKIPVTIRGLSAASIDSRCQSERQLALKAREATEVILHGGSVVLLKNISRSGHYRLGADVYVDGINIADYLVSNGFAARKLAVAQLTWCEQ